MALELDTPTIQTIANAVSLRSMSPSHSRQLEFASTSGRTLRQNEPLTFRCKYRNAVEAAEMAVSEQEEVDQMCSFGEQSVPIARHFFIVQLSGSGRERVIIAPVQCPYFRLNLVRMASAALCNGSSKSPTRAMSFNRLIVVSNSSNDEHRTVVLPFCTSSGYLP